MTHALCAADAGWPERQGGCSCSCAGRAAPRVVWCGSGVTLPDSVRGAGQLKALPATAEVMEQMFALWRAMAVLGDVEGASTFDDRLVGVFKAGCADVLRDFEAMRSIDQLRNPHAGGSTAVASSPQQPHVTTVTSLLAYGAQVVSRVLEERVPHAAKVGTRLGPQWLPLLPLLQRVA